MKDTILTVTITVSEEDYEQLSDSLIAVLDHDIYDIEYTWNEKADPYGAGYHGPSARTDEDRLQAQAEATTDDPFRDYYADEDQHGSSAITKEEKVDELVDILERSAEYWERLQQQAEATKDDPFADYHGPSAMTAEEHQAKLSEYDRNGIDSFSGLWRGQVRVMIYFDRFDICEAYYLYASQYHAGKSSPEYAIFSTLSRLNFKPAPTLHLTENGQAIYNSLVNQEETIRRTR